MLFGSVTFAQVNKNDTINKPSSRKVSAEDLKKFPVEDVNGETGEIKGETRFKEHKDSGYLKIKGERTIKGENQKSEYLKVSPDNSARIKGEGMAIKGKGDKLSTTEKQHYTIKMSNANKKTAEGATEEIVNDDNAATTQKKHVSNIKWTPGKVAKDSLATPTSKTSGQFIKIGDIKGEKEK